jgi:hypothetical protein
VCAVGLLLLWTVVFTFPRFPFNCGPCDALSSLIPASLNFVVRGWVGLTHSHTHTVTQSHSHTVTQSHSHTPLGKYSNVDDGNSD